MIFAGFDSDVYPGDNNMALVKAKTNLSFAGFYLGPAPCHKDTSWMKARASLVSQGWGLAPVFVGRQLTEAAAGGGAVIDPGVPASEGYTDGNAAADLMSAAGFDTGSYVYLDIETGPPLSAVLRSYVQAWAARVRQRQFCPGIYCSHLLADQMAQVVPGARIWAVKVKTVAQHDASEYGGSMPLYDPHASGFQYAYLWQHEQNAVIDVDGLQLDVDLDVAILRDPSR